jgi:hypothetical protein
MFIAAICRISRLWKQPRLTTTDEWIKKIWHLYNNEILLNHKEE